MNHLFLFRRRTALFLLSVICLAAGTARADLRQFSLGSTSLTLEEVTTNTAVYYTSMRLNRALNAWNVEVTLSNRSTRALSGPLVLLVDSATGTSGLQKSDGMSGGQAFVDLTPQIAGGILMPGETSAPRTLTLGRTSGTPSLVTRIYAPGNPPADTAVGFVRTLNGAGQPLGGVMVEEAGPVQTLVRQTDPDFGVATLGQTGGNYLWKFSAPGYLPVWRMHQLSTGGVARIISPRLTQRDTNSVVITPLSGGMVSRNGIAVAFDVGSVSSNQTVTLTPLTGQTLPAFLPQGWSPLQAFWLEMPSTPTAPVQATLPLWGPLKAGDAAALVQWDSQAFLWQTVALFPDPATNSVTATLPGPGAYAVVVGDASPNAPPTPELNQRLLPALTPAPAENALTASGEVVPSVSPASLVPELVTGTATVVITNASDALPSGLVLRCDISDTYQLQDGTRRVPPHYENYIVGYQRPGDTAPNTLQAVFPMRPLFLFDASALNEANVHVDVLPLPSFGGSILSTNGGVIANGPLRLLAGAGSVPQPQAALLDELDPVAFSDLTTGLTSVAAFELTLSGIAPGERLSLQMSGVPSNALFVVARVLNERRAYGLEPVARLASDAEGRLSSLETNATDRLPGITGPGQYLLIRGHGTSGVGERYRAEWRRPGRRRVAGASQAVDHLLA